MARISGKDLLENPQNEDYDDDIGEMPSASDTPFDKGFGLLSETEGVRLEIMTRTTPEMAKAGSIALAHRERFPNMHFITRLYEQGMRHAISIRGMGRQEVATTVQAFSGATASYYDADAEKQKSEDRVSYIPLGKGNDNDG